MHHAFRIGEREHNVELSRGANGYRLHLNGATVAVDLKTAPDGRKWLSVGDLHVEVVVATHGEQVFVHLEGVAYELGYQHPLVRLAATGHGAADDAVRAPMPGAIVSIAVKAGEAVSQGQTMLVMESMKMETTLTASRDGVVETVHFGIGQTFDRDALLLSLVAGEPK